MCVKSDHSIIVITTSMDQSMSTNTCTDTTCTMYMEMSLAINGTIHYLVMG